MLDDMAEVWVHDVPRAKPWRGAGSPVVVEPKYDGWRLTAFMQEDPAVGLCVFGRKREAHLELSHLLSGCDWYRKLEARMPPRTSVDGELWVPGQPASAVVTAMRESPRDLRFTAFATNGMGHGWGDARYWLRLAGIDTPGQVRYIGQTDEELLEYARDLWDGAEGVVLKEAMCDGWYKLKREETADLVVMDLKPGDEFGKYSDTTGSIIGGRWDGTQLVEVACVSGMDDDLRRQLGRGDVGRVFECRYQYVGAGGRLRHPRFVRWRDDKYPHEATDIPSTGDT